jgi:DNA-binding CsgD family transcriptional regulator
MLLELMAALSSSLNVAEVLQRSYGVMSKLLVADCAAICVSKPGQPDQYEWGVVDQMPQRFFARYPELAHEDFVRRAVMQRPNMVLRDSEMLPSREALKRSVMYEHCRAMNMPLEHVMAVLLDVGLDWHGGYTLYREGPKPFSLQEQTFLQRLTPTLAATVRNCRLMGQAVERGDILDALFRHGGSESVVLVPPATEVMRTTRATELVQRWFAPVECGRHGLPLVWLRQLERLAGSSGPMSFGDDTHVRTARERSLKVTFVGLPEKEGRRPWALLLQEVSHVVPVPVEWREVLTPREVQVVDWLLKGVDNQYIADQLGCSLDTVKTHLKKIFVKLAVPSRAKLILLAQELNTRGGTPAQ